jgi:hypothetical protein
MQFSLRNLYDQTLNMLHRNPSKYGTSGSASGGVAGSFLILSMLLTSSTTGEPIRLSPSDLPMHAQFGYAVAMSGNVLVSATYEGAVYIFRHDGSTWNQEQKLNGPYFHTLAIDGDVLVVGGPDFLEFFRFGGSVWSLEQFTNVYAEKVDINGDTAVVGSYGDAYVYHHTGGSWTLQQTISGGGVNFATTVAISGNSLAVSGYQTVTLYRYDGSSWQVATVLNPGEISTPESGYPLAMDNGYFAVSSVRPSGGGVIRVYKDEPSGWMLQQELNPPGEASDLDDVRSLALDGELLAVGNPLDRGGQGGAWVYRNCAGIWSIERSIQGPVELPTLFGSSVALSGGFAGISAPSEYSLEFPSVGAVYGYAAGVDCNQNGVHDGCERMNQPAMDCDHNVILDDCESNADCNQNGLRDRCDLASSVSEDCNENHVPDECDLTSGNSTDQDADGIPDECLTLYCEDALGGPVFSLKAAKVNGERVVRRNEIGIRPGDVLSTEIFISCWGSAIDVVRIFQSSILVRDGALSGTAGTLLPVGWDAPLNIDPCPCDTPPYLTCNAFGSCSGSDHDADRGAFVSVDRPDFVHQGFSGLVAVDNSYLYHFRFGGTTSEGGPTDLGLARYAGSLELLASDGSCGTFIFSFEPEDTYICNDVPFVYYCVNPQQLEPLVIHVCEDDGIFCNGLETCDPNAGCQIIPPPSCDDGVVCTVDSCDEGANGCAHALSHTACDDGNICTRDECTSAGCVNIDDQCGDIPAASHWGLAALALCLLIAAKLRFPAPRRV